MRWQCPNCGHECDAISEVAKAKRRRNGCSPKGGRPFSLSRLSLRKLWEIYLAKEDDGYEWNGKRMRSEIRKLKVGYVSPRTADRLLLKMQRKDQAFLIKIGIVEPE